MFKNLAGQKFVVFAFDSTTNLPKTGDAANIAAYIAKDFGAVTQLGDTSATEMDATNAKGFYLFDGTQAETNADMILVSGKSSTANIVVIGAPAAIFTYPTTGILAPATAGRTLVVDAAGLADANAVKLGPTGSGTAQTARDVGLSVLLSAGTGTGQLDFASGVVKVNLVQILATTLTETAGQIAGGIKKFFNIATPAATMDHGVLVDTVSTLTTLPAIPNNWLTAAGIAAAALNGKGDWMVSYVQPTGFLAATFPGSVASPTNITAASGVALTAAYDLAKTASQAGDAMALTVAERNATADALLDRANGIETGITLRKALRGIAAACFGDAAGFGGGSATYKATDGSKVRITATLLGSGNKTIVVDLT